MEAFYKFIKVISQFHFNEFLFFLCNIQQHHLGHIQLILPWTMLIAVRIIPVSKQLINLTSLLLPESLAAGRKKQTLEVSVHFYIFTKNSSEHKFSIFF